MRCTSDNPRSFSQRYLQTRFDVLFRRLLAEETFHVLPANAVFENISSFDVGFVQISIVTQTRVVNRAFLDLSGELEGVSRSSEDFFQF